MWPVLPAVKYTTINSALPLLTLMWVVSEWDHEESSCYERTSAGLGGLCARS